MYFWINLLRIKRLHVSSITYSSSGAAAQTAFGILRAYNVSETATMPQPTDIIRKQYTKCRLSSGSWGEQIMLETSRGTWFWTNWLKSTSRWFHYTDIQQTLLLQVHKISRISRNLIATRNLTLLTLPNVPEIGLEFRIEKEY
jgi:hypothetical protein